MHATAAAQRIAVIHMLAVTIGPRFGKARMLGRRMRRGIRLPALLEPPLRIERREVGAPTAVVVARIVGAQDYDGPGEHPPEHDGTDDPAPN